MITLPMPKLTDSKLIYIWSKIDKRGPDDCWMWLGYTNTDGRGQTKIEYHSYVVPRLIYYITHGIDPGELLVCHTCDHPTCCNPRHLWLGTQKENVDDCSSKERKPRGEANGHATLTEKIVKEILKSSDTNTALAKRFNVSQVCISRIRSGKRWAHLQETRLL